MQQAAAYRFADQAGRHAAFNASAYERGHPAAIDDRAFEAMIARAIDAALLERRDTYAGQPQAWHLFCEASHVATLCPLLRDAFIARVAEQRGADIALRLSAKADAIRAAAIARLCESVDESVAA